MKKLKHIVGWVLKSLGALVALSLLFSYLGRYVSPATTWFFSFFGLIFPFLFFFNIILFVFWLLLKRKTFWIHLAVLIPGLFFLPAYIQLRFSTEKETKQANEFKILTYNVHTFGFNYKTKTLKKIQDIKALVTEEAPDLICFQEAMILDTAALKKTFQNYPYMQSCLWRRYGKTYYGAVILSRYPILHKGVILFSNTSGNVCVYADIKVGKQTVRVYNNHLESTGLNLALSFSRIKKDEQRNEEIKEVSTRLRDAFVKRAGQVDTVAAHIAASPFPVFVCGDFNDMPMSYTYRKMKGSLSDAFIAAGSGIPSTFRNYIPAFRIDYIFSNKLFKAKRFYIPKVTYSDHYPVVAVFKMGEESLSNE